MFFLAEGLSFEFWENWLLQFVRCISGNSELHSNQLPRERLSCFPHLANRTWKKHGKTIMIGIPPVAYLVFVYVCIFSLISSIVYGLLFPPTTARRFLADTRYRICNDPIYGKACYNNKCDGRGVMCLSLDL